MIGKIFAHYKILDKLGAGGMGEVWRATDSRLGREVALKLLPEAFAKDAERMARFHREAQVLASLNHPNIAAIHGLETEGDTSALALELVEGPTLGDRLRAEALSADEALAIAVQIAEAVEYAHESGVMHRDLKPENVKIDGHGRVKVLDFGLAKALTDDPASSGSDLSSPTISPAITSPVITGALTGANVILGTAAYMSPEQARGQAVDKRADIWSFGVILFEMLTRRRLFEGETVSDTLASVLKTEIPWDRLPADTPPRVVRLLRRCLERKPKERLRDMGDVRLLLREAMEGKFPEAPAAAVAGEPARHRPWLLPVAIVASAVVAAAAVWSFRSPPEPPLRKFALAHSAQAGSPNDTAVAPDGSAVVFAQRGELHIRDFREFQDRELVSGKDLDGLFWSPDGEWIGYGADNALWKIRRTGGEPVRLSPLSGKERFDRVAGAAWGDDGRIVFASGDGGLWSVPDRGGDVSVVAAPGEGVSDFHHASGLPGGAGWLVVVHRAAGTYDTIAAILPDGSRRDILHVPGEQLFDPWWSPTGHVLYSRANLGVYAVAVKAGEWTATGEPFLVASGYGWLSVGRDGTLAMRRSRAGGAHRTLALVDRTGKVVRSFPPAQGWRRWPKLAPDGSQILAAINDDENDDLWLVDVERGTRQRVTDDEGTVWSGIWSADGQEIVYVVSDASTVLIRSRPANGVGEPRDLFPGRSIRPSPDGRWFLTTRRDTSTIGNSNDVWLIPAAEGAGEARPLVQTPASEQDPEPSPGTDPFLAYVSDRTGRSEVYLTTYPESRGTWPVSVGGGSEPSWRGDGRELYFSNGDSVLVAEVRTVDGLPKPGKPTLLFVRPDAGRLGSAAYSACPSEDGELFAISMEEEREVDESPVSIVVVQNWFEEFRER